MKMKKPRPEDFGVSDVQTTHFKDLAARLDQEENERMHKILMWSVISIGALLFVYLIDPNGTNGSDYIAALFIAVLGG